MVFQRLIGDRKFLATYYTRPAAAALLAGLAAPLQRPIVGTDWGDFAALSRLRIGDFACGTGTLLSTAYQRVGLLHELEGGNSETLHPVMMRQGLVGLDVLTVAVHLTAAMLAGSHPRTPFDGECLLTMPYGRQNWGACVGSLELLAEQISIEVIQAAAQTAGGKGAKEVRDLMYRVGHKQFSLVIMNPPFTRHGAREGDRTQVHNPAFAAFGADEAEQDLLADRLRRLARRGLGHGHAGMASYFADLAHRKLAPEGTLALVLPLTAMSGSSWDKIRDLWRTEYSNQIVVTIAESASNTRSFSADTGMAEFLIVARKSHPHTAPRAVFAILGSQPESTLHGGLLADEIAKLISSGTVRKLEDGPFGGTRILLGSTAYGEVIDCPLPAEGAWQVAGIKDLGVGQSAYQLSQGRLWIEGMTADRVPNIPICGLGTIIERIGPHDLDITGAEIKSDGLPQGPFDHIPGIVAGMAYPCLWNHDASRERGLMVEPDSHCQVRSVGGQVPPALQERADMRWQTASRTHYNRDLQFNAQSLIVAFTHDRTLGGRAWPTVVFSNPDQEFAFALWSNSTLGLLCHWWMANKSQAGRGTFTIMSIPTVSTLDVRKLTPAQRAAARRQFQNLSSRRFLPFDQIHEDPARAALDEALLVHVLGLDPALCASSGPLDRLRQKLAAEPQIHGDKRTRLVFTQTGEKSEPIADPAPLPQRRRPGSAPETSKKGRP